MGYTSYNKLCHPTSIINKDMLNLIERKVGRLGCRSLAGFQTMFSVLRQCLC